MRKITFILLIALSFTACKSVQEITKAHVNEAALNHKTFEKVCVLAMMPDTDMKERLEKRMVKALNKKGINSVASAEIAPNKLKSLRGVSVEMLDSILKESGCDALYTISLLDTKTESKFIHNTETIGTAAKFSFIYYEDYQSFYSYRNSAEHQGDGMQEQTTYVVESVLYDVKTNQYVWSVQSEAIQPASIKSWMRTYSDQMVEKLHEMVGFEK
ncbi:MAG: hypothetical protein ACK5LR_10630 [Mangrovibacterium sp.]